MTDVIKLKPITKSDYRFLYHLLEQRGRNENISHRKMPTWKEHNKFILSKPYTKWYIIYLNQKKIGSIYLSKTNEIGIHFIKDRDSIEMKEESLVLLMEKNPRPRYLINVNPKNIKVVDFIKKKKFKLIQHTYELVGNE